MKGYLLDTNIVIAHLKGNPLVKQHIHQAEAAGYPVMLNAISYYETRRGLIAASAQAQLKIFDRLWQTQGIAMLDKSALDKAAAIYAELRATGQLIEDADILIAAIALVNDLILVTNNLIHFLRVSELQTEDWLTP